MFPSDWLKRQYEDIRGHFKWYLLGSIWTFTIWVAHHLTVLFHAPTFVFWVVTFAISCAAFYFVALSQSAVQANRQSANLNIATPTSVRGFDELEKFFKDYSNSLMLETETNVQTRAHRYKAGSDREAFLVTTCARLIILGFSEQVWLTIYKSQIRALEEVNKHPNKIDYLQQFYAAGLREDPILYGNGTYSFTSWLAFLKGYGLILETGDSVSIAPRGREFLKYLIHTGRSANERRG